MNLNSVGGRKFVLTVLFLVFAGLNYGFRWGIEWQGLVAMGAVIGVYDIANAIKGSPPVYASSVGGTDA